MSHDMFNGTPDHHCTNISTHIGLCLITADPTVIEAMAPASVAELFDPAPLSKQHCAQT